MDIGDAPEVAGVEDGAEPSQNKLEDMIKELSTALTGKCFNKKQAMITLREWQNIGLALSFMIEKATNVGQIYATKFDAVSKFETCDNILENFT